MPSIAIPSAGAAPAGRAVARKRMLRVGTGLLVAGVAALAAMDLSFAFGWDASLLLLLGGLVSIGLGWMMLVVLGARPALAGTAAVLASAGLLLAAAPTLRDASWRMMAWTHRASLERAVRILAPAETRPEPAGARLCDRLAGARAPDCAALEAAMAKFGAGDAWKDGGATVFLTYGWVGNRGGILHCPGGMEACARPRRRHLSGDWYRWWDG